MQANCWLSCSGAAAACEAGLDDFMAADETFSSVKALQEATAKDVGQRIATAHLRPLPSTGASSRPQGIHPIPGKSLLETSSLFKKNPFYSFKLHKSFQNSYPLSLSLSSSSWEICICSLGQPLINGPRPSPLCIAAMQCAEVCIMSLILKLNMQWVVCACCSLLFPTAASDIVKIVRLLKAIAPRACSAALSQGRAA